MKILMMPAAFFALATAQAASAEPQAVNEVRTGWSERETLEHLRAKGYEVAEVSMDVDRHVVSMRRAGEWTARDDISILFTGAQPAASVALIRRSMHAKSSGAVPSRNAAHRELGQRYGRPTMQAKAVANHVDFVFFRGESADPGCTAFPAQLLSGEAGLDEPIVYSMEGSPCRSGLGAAILFRPGVRGQPVSAIITILWDEEQPQQRGRTAVADFALADFAGEWRAIEATQLTERG